MGSHWRLLSPILGKGVRSLTLNIKTADMNFQATFLLQLSSSWHLISIQLCLYNAFKCNIFRRQLSYSFIMSLVLTWFSGRCEKFRKPKLAIHFGKRLFFKRIDGVPRNLVGKLLEQRGTKLCQRFSFLFLLLCFCFFVFVLFSVFDHLFIKCKYFSIGSGGAQVYFKKNWFDFKEMLTTLRRLDFCDWNCAVTFHERSCLIPYPFDGKVSLRVLLAVDSRLFEGELVKKWSKSRTVAPHPLPQSLCIWYTGLQRLLLFFGLFLSIFFCCCFLVCAQGC